jgi:DNA-binding CsgD family transcriptional regulator
MAAGRLEEAKMLWDAGAAESRRRGSLAGLAFCLVMRAPVEVRRGSPLAAEADVNELLELGRNMDLLATEPLRVPFPWLLAPLIDALLEQGKHDAAARAFDESPLGDEFPELLQFNYLLHSLGRLRLAQGRGAEAMGYLRECGRRLEAWGVKNPGLVSWRSDLALALLSLGLDEEALACAEEEVSLARLFEVPRELGMSLRVSGLVRGGDEGLELLQEAVAILDSSTAGLERARALTDLGAALRRRGNRADAREPLRQGLDLAQRSGAAGLAERAHTELLATGSRPRRLALAGLEALTASERRVAEMAAKSLTNRQIAETLFVTEKTVEGHLHQAYRKLDIESRTQLPQALEPPA